MSSESPEGPHERLVGRLREVPNFNAGRLAHEAADELDRQRAEVEALRKALRRHIRVYRVSDDHADPEAFADELLARELTPNDSLSSACTASAESDS